MILFYSSIVANVLRVILSNLTLIRYDRERELIQMHKHNITSLSNNLYTWYKNKIYYKSKRISLYIIFWACCIQGPIGALIYAAQMRLQFIEKILKDLNPTAV